MNVNGSVCYGIQAISFRTCFSDRQLFHFNFDLKSHWCNYVLFFWSTKAVVQPDLNGDKWDKICQCAIQTVFLKQNHWGWTTGNFQFGHFLVVLSFSCRCMGPNCFQLLIELAFVVCFKPTSNQLLILYIITWWIFFA